MEFSWQKKKEIKLTKELQAALQASNPNQIMKILKGDEGITYLHMMAVNIPEISQQ